MRKTAIVVDAMLIFILCIGICLACRRDPVRAPLSDKPCEAGLSGAIRPLQFALVDFMERVEVVNSLEPCVELNGGMRETRLAQLARASFSLGETKKGNEAKKMYKQGRHYAKLLIRKQPRKAEGYYWLALNQCGLCENMRLRGALAAVPDIVKNLRSALAIDPTYDQGGPPRVLGRILAQAPGWPISVGDLKESLSMLLLAVKIAPENSTNHLYLAETLNELGEGREACLELDRALAANCHATSPEGLSEDHRQATKLKIELHCGGKDPEAMEILRFPKPGIGAFCG